MLLYLLFEQLDELLRVCSMAAYPDRGEPERCRRGNRRGREARKPVAQTGKLSLRDQVRHQVRQQNHSAGLITGPKGVLTGFFTPALFFIPVTGLPIEFR